MPEVLVLLVAFFLGPTTNLGDAFIFQNPSFSDKESCQQFVAEAQDWLHVYLSAQWKTLPDVYASKLHCMTSDEFQKFFTPKSGRKIAI